MRISEAIEQLLIDLMSNAENNMIEVKRNELASQLGCVPSQINYVISTRFTNERGYIVESRRGGGGYIRIIRRKLEDRLLSECMQIVGDHLPRERAQALLERMLQDGLVTAREYDLIGAAISDRSLSLPHEQRDQLRAKIFKNILLYL